MASTLPKSLAKTIFSGSWSSLSSSSPLKALLRSPYRSYAKASSEKVREERVVVAEDDAVPTSGISRPLSEILKELNKRVPDSLISVRVEDGFSVKYVPWFCFPSRFPFFTFIFFLPGFWLYLVFSIWFMRSMSVTFLVVANFFS